MNEESYNHLEAAGGCARTLSILGITAVTILIVGTFIGGGMSNMLLSPPDTGLGGGYQIKKKFFLSISTTGYLLLTGIYVYWLILFSTLFRFSKAAIEASTQRSSDHTDIAMNAISVFFKLLVIGISVLFLLFLLPVILAF